MPMHNLGLAMAMLVVLSAPAMAEVVKIGNGGVQFVLPTHSNVRKQCWDPSIRDFVKCSNNKRKN
jgi:hypothetical protein